MIKDAGSRAEADLREVLEPCLYKLPLPMDDNSSQLRSDFLDSKICRFGMNSARRIHDIMSDSLMPNFS